MNHRWTLINETFDRLIELPEAERRAELERLSTQDRDLADIVQGLLEDDAAGGFPPPPQPLPFYDPPGQIGIGSRIGVYEIRKVLGEGSCGKVFQAVRIQDFPQTVAIKVLQGHLDSKPCTRFELETQTLALLDHPNVVRLYDCGTTEAGYPFLVTEFVDGEHLTAYCQRNGLGLDARVELVAQAARAMAYAHENEVLHRDLCPSNVMVTRCGTVKIIDFGLVHVIRPETKTILTDKGITIGTPGFIAPETISGRGNRYSYAVDTYGMGAILYRLITNRPTFPGESPYEVCHAATVSDPVPPRKVDPRIPRDLETIVRKAMAREPAERFETMQAFVDQLDRYLARQPLTIRPPSIREKIEKWGIRHRNAVMAWSIVLALTLTALLGILGLANLRVNKALEEAGIDRRRAERTNDILKSFLKDMTLSSVTLTETMPLGSPKTHEYLEGILDIAERAIVDLPANREDPDFLYRAGLANHHVALSFQARDAEANRPRALELYDRAVDLFREATAINPANEWYRYNLARSLVFRAFVRNDGKDVEGAVGDSREATRIAIALDRDYPGKPEWIDAVAFHHITLAGFLHAKSDFEECRREAEASLAVTRDLISKYPERPQFLANEYRVLKMLAELAERENRLEAARSLTREAMGVNEAQFVKTPDEGHFLETSQVSLQSKMAGIEARLGNLASAGEYHQKAIELAEGMARKYPQFDLYVLLPVRMKIEAARFHFDRNAVAEGKRLYQDVIGSLESLLAKRPDMIEARRALAEIYESCPVVELKNDRKAAELRKDLKS